MDVAPDPDWYFDNVLVHASPGSGRVDALPAAAWRAWWSARAGESDDPARSLAADQGFVASTAQLDALGWQRHDHRRVRRRGEWVAVCPGVSSPVRVDDGASRPVLERRRHALAASAAALRRPGHAVAGRSAAILTGLPTVRVPGRPELGVVDARPTLGRRTGAHVFGATLAADAVGSWFGVPVTCVERTLVDLARHCREDAIMAADAALRESLTSASRLDGALSQAAGWPGVRQAREILAQAHPLAESPLESLLRLRMHDDGFPVPRLQAVIPDPGRGRTYRVDFLLEQARLVIEADGRVKYRRGADELWDEKRRETRLRALGYSVERVTWSDVVEWWPETRERLRLALAFPAGMDRSGRR